MRIYAFNISNKPIFFIDLNEASMASLLSVQFLITVDQKMQHICRWCYRKSFKYEMNNWAVSRYKLNAYSQFIDCKCSLYSDCWSNYSEIESWSWIAVYANSIVKRQMIMWHFLCGQCGFELRFRDPRAANSDNNKNADMRQTEICDQMLRIKISNLWIKNLGLSVCGSFQGWDKAESE